MKKIFYTTLFLAFSYFDALAQSGFSKVYDFGERAAVFKNVILQNDTLVISGSVAPQNFGAWSAMFARLDTNGQVLDMHYFVDSTGNTFYQGPGWSTIPTSDGGYLATGLMFDAGAVIKMNQDGTLGFYAKFPVEHYFAIQRDIEVPDGFLLAGDFQAEDLKVDVCLLKINHQGQEMWRKYYDTSEFSNVLASFVQLDTNRFILTSSEANTNVTNDDAITHSRYWIVDSLGNVLRTWRNEEANEEIGMYNLQILPNGNWLYWTGDYEYFSNGIEDFTNWVTIICRDTNMNILWKQQVPHFPTPGMRLNSLHPTNDGNWVAVTGLYTPHTNADSTWRAGTIRKFSPEGDSIWQRQDSVWSNPIYGSDNELCGVVVLPSGSLIAVGFVTYLSDTLQKSYAWIVKVTADGCLETDDCQISEITEIKDNYPSLLVAPNPSTTAIEFSSPGVSGKLLVSDIQGRVILETEFQDKVFWDVRDVVSGLYFYRLSSRDSTSYSGKVVVAH